VDLAQLLGHGNVRNEQELMDCSLLAFNPALEVNAALLADRLLGLRAADAFSRPSLRLSVPRVSSEPSISMRAAAAGRS
jgi:hypothetical protein